MARRQAKETRPQNATTKKHHGLSLFTLVPLAVLASGLVVFQYRSEVAEKATDQAFVFDAAQPTDLQFSASRGTLHWEFQNFSRQVHLQRLEGLLSAEEASEILSQLPDAFATDPDSVDNLPTYEYVLEHQQVNKSKGNASQSLRELTRDIVAARLLPFVRRVHDCPDCRVCTSLIRRYVAGERLRHPAHYDTDALVTVVVALSAGHSGGLYVCTNEGTERFVQLDTGHAVVHGHDLEHGVWVKAGRRYSWILWFQDSEHCEGALPRWHLTAAEAGDPIAQYQLALLYETGSAMVSEDPAAALDWMSRSAAAGYARAQHKMGMAALEGRTQPKNESRAVEWLLAASKQNLSVAMYSAGRLLEAGIGTRPDVPAAASLYEHAAQDSFRQHSDAKHRLARLLWRGGSVSQDRDRAILLWKQAASQGSEAAIRMLNDTRAS